MSLVKYWKVIIIFKFYTILLEKVVRWNFFDLWWGYGKFNIKIWKKYFMKRDLEVSVN